jgi:hypothetical protein
MKPSLALLIVCASLIPAVQVSAKTVLPDACGDDSVKFDVAAKKSPGAPEQPAAGKALIVFAENENQPLGPFMHATIRFGLDGAWAGANNSNSYFTVAVDPGVHHMCASWQSVLHMLSKSVDMASFTAEPGKVYYFAANVKVTPVGDSQATYDFNLSQMDDDAGKYRLKAWKLATWTTSK